MAGGGYAQFCVAPAGQCLPVPKGLSMVQAASLPETFFTVWQNVFAIAKLQAGDLKGARGDFVILANSLDTSTSEEVRQRAQAAMQLIDSGTAKDLAAAVKAAAALPPTPPISQLPAGLAPQAAPNAQ